LEHLINLSLLYDASGHLLCRSLSHYNRRRVFLYIMKETQFSGADSAMKYFHYSNQSSHCGYKKFLRQKDKVREHLAVILRSQWTDIQFIRVTLTSEETNSHCSCNLLRN
jgi:hypothetical protein